MSPVTITKDCPVQPKIPKAHPHSADLLFMVNSISSSHASQSNEAVQSAAPKPQAQQTQKTSSQPSDTVTLSKNAANQGSGNK
jgi:hypothetical protein